MSSSSTPFHSGSGPIVERGEIKQCWCPEPMKGPVKVYIALTEDNFGRRFMGCPYYRKDSQGRKCGCKYFEWLDGDVFVDEHIVELIHKLKVENESNVRQRRSLQRENREMREQLRRSPGSKVMYERGLSGSVDETTEELVGALLQEVEQRMKQGKLKSAWNVGALTLAAFVLAFAVLIVYLCNK